MNVITPAVPRRLQITQGMVEDFLCDPVLATRVILGFKLDVFQAARLRWMWWVPNLMDSSGFSSGKTICDWAYIQLRCILIPDHVAGVFYPVAETGRNTFWPYYTSCNAPLFRAHLGRLDREGESDGASQTRGSACYKAFYANGSVMLLPAPSFMKQAATMASLRLNTLLVEEWTHVDAASQGIDQQLVQRVTRAGYNQHHPIWANHIKFTAPAKTQMHPGWERVQVFDRQVKQGNPRYAHLSFCYKDYSDLPAHTGKSFAEEYRIDETIRVSKNKLNRAEFLGEGLGIWSRSGKGWFTEEAVLSCIDLGKALGLTPQISRGAATADGGVFSHGLTRIPPGGRDGRNRRAEEQAEREFFFVGIDPAPAEGTKSDDGAIVVMRARARWTEESGELPQSPADWERAFVYAKRVRNASTRQWAGLITQLHGRFRFSRICLDPGGGGQWIKRDLSSTRQLIEGIEQEVTPIVTLDNVTVTSGQFVLAMFKRGDPALETLWPEAAGDDVLRDAAYSAMREGIETAQLAMPRPYPEWRKEELTGWPEEKVWALRNLSVMAHQLQNVYVLTKEDGSFLLTKRNARQFSAKGKKDFASAAIYANTAFLSWLMNIEQEVEQQGRDVMFLAF